jgi:transposase-like protein
MMCWSARSSKAALCNVALDQSDRAPHGEIKRRPEVVGIFPNEDANTRLVVALLLEQNDESA